MIYNNLCPVAYLQTSRNPRRFSRRYTRITHAVQDLQDTGVFDLRHVLNHRRNIRKHSLVQDNPASPPSSDSSETSNKTEEGALETLNTLMAGLMTGDVENAACGTVEGGNLTAQAEVASCMQQEQVLKKSRYIRNLKPPRPLHASTIIELE